MATQQGETGEELISQAPSDKRSGRLPTLRSRLTVGSTALFVAVALSVAVLDQLTKWAVRANFEFGEAWSPGEVGFIRIVHFTNSGAAFGIFQGQTQILIVTGMMGIAAIVLYFLFPPADHLLIRVALAMQLGGAVGNLSDRIMRGEVTDWIDVGTWPVFNLADSSITVSVVALFIFLVWVEGTPRDQKRLNLS